MTSCQEEPGGACMLGGDLVRHGREVEGELNAFPDWCT